MSTLGSDNFAIRCNAYHEAGHAVAAVKLGIRLDGVDIQSSHVPGIGLTMGGANLALPDPRTLLGKGEAAVMHVLIVIFAGAIAEQRVDSNAGIDFGHPQADATRAFNYAAAAICKPVSKNGILVTPKEEVERKSTEIEACLQNARQKTEMFVADYGTAIDAVAERLLAVKSLTGAKVATLVASTMEDAQR